MGAARFLLLAAVVAASGSAKGEPPTDAELRVASAKAEHDQRELDRALAPVKSLSDFYKHMQQDNAAAAAFRKLDASSQAVFVNSLTFNEKGLTGFNYKVVEDFLTLSEAYHLLGCFGVQRVVRGLKGIKVESRADVEIKQHLKALESAPWSGGDGDSAPEAEHQHY